MSLPDIKTLNQSSLNEFNQVITVLFEPSEPLSNALYSKKPFKTYNHLLQETQKAMKQLSFQDKLKVINAHPRLGAAKETLSKLSFQEQGYHKERESDEQVNRLLALGNEKYEEKHGFKVFF